MNRKGFTLIELMIVISIVGILAAIAIPKFADLVRQSKRAGMGMPVATVTFYDKETGADRTYRVKRFIRQDVNIAVFETMDGKRVTFNGPHVVEE